MLKFNLLYVYLVLLNNNVDGNYAPARVNRVANDNITLIAILHKMSYTLASDICNHAGGEIVNRLFATVAMEFFHTLHEDYEKFWLGAQFINGTWIWNDGIRVRLQNFAPKGFKNDSKDCLVYDRITDTVEQVDCSDSYSTICNEEGGANLGKLMFVLIQKHIATIPQIHLLYAADNDRTIGTNKYEYTLQLIKNLANTVVLNQNRTFGVEWYSSEASIINFFKNSSNCLVRTYLDELFRSKFSTNHSSAIYYNAFKAVEEEVAAMTSKDKTLFVFFFVMRPDTGPVGKTNELVQKLKNMGVKIIVIAWGHDIIPSTLQEIPSIIDDQLQLYVFNTMRSFLESNKYLKTKRKFMWNDCSRIRR